MTKRKTTTAAAATLTELRDQMAVIDTALVDLLAQRLELARRVGTHKRAAGLATLDARREAHVISAAARHARHAGVPEEDVRNIFWQVLAMSRRVQQERPT